MTTRLKINIAAFGALGGILAALLMGQTWTPPATVTRGQLISETWLNTYVRDNTTVLYNIFGTISGLFRNVHLRTHPDRDLTRSNVMLVSADLIVMSDGLGVTGWGGQVADIAAAGAGGLDTGAEANDRYYEIHAIRKPSDGTKAIMLHLAPDWFDDETQTSHNSAVNFRDNSARQKVAQGIQFDEAAPLSSVVMKALRVGTPVGSGLASMYLTLESDATGSPSGTVLATSQKIDVNSLNVAAQDVVFVFGTPYTVTASVQYHLVLSSDVTTSAANYMQIRQQNTDVYADGQVKTYDGATWTGATADLYFTATVLRNTTALTLPSGYTQYAKIGYVRNNSAGHFTSFVAMDHLVIPNIGTAIVAGASSAIPGVQDVSAHLPPTLTKSWWYVGLPATAERTVTVGNSEGGYVDSFSVRLGGQAGVSSVDTWRGEVGPITNNYKWVFFKVSGDTADLTSGPYEWR